MAKKSPIENLALNLSILIVLVLSLAIGVIVVTQKNTSTSAKAAGCTPGTKLCSNGNFYYCVGGSRPYWQYNHTCYRGVCYPVGVGGDCKYERG